MSEVKRYTREELKQLIAEAITVDNNSRKQLFAKAELEARAIPIIRQLLAEVDAKEKEVAELKSERWEYRQAMIDTISGLRLYGQIYDDNDMLTDADTLETVMEKYPCTP